MFRLIKIPECEVLWNKGGSRFLTSAVRIGSVLSMVVPFPELESSMAAMAKEKAQDEKNLKILRELAALSANKYCFDCQQRGPTYINVTVGSFVCTSCSGLLRGLNPPHRVKSITMASFTSEEMEQIKNKGNEYCKQVWLGKYDPAGTIENEYQNIHKIREFMIQKYEDKKYYVEPEFAVKKPKPRAPSIPGTATVTRSQTTIQTRPPKPSIHKTGWMSQDFSSESTHKDTDLFTDFGSDVFKQNAAAKTEENDDSSSFADFSSAFGNTAKTSSEFESFSTTSTTSSSSASTKVSIKKPAPPPPDRYAALADLDNQLHQQQVPIAAVPVTIPSVAVPSSTAILWSGGNSAFGPVMFEAGAPNPFGNTITTWAQPNVIASANPFQAMSQHMTKTVPLQGISNGISNTNGIDQHNPNQNGASMVGPWSVNTDQTWGSAYPVSQVDAFSNKNGVPLDHYNPWAQSLVSESANPFLNGVGANTAVPQKSASNNPFL